MEQGVLDEEVALEEDVQLKHTLAWRQGPVAEASE